MTGGLRRNFADVLVRSRLENDVSSELIGVKQADALPNALGAFG